MLSNTNKKNVFESIFCIILGLNICIFQIIFLILQPKIVKNRIFYA